MVCLMFGKSVLDEVFVIGELFDFDWLFFFFLVMYEISDDL